MKTLLALILLTLGALLGPIRALPTHVTHSAEIDWCDGPCYG